MHIFCLDYTVSVSKSYPLRVQNKLTTSTLPGEELMKELDEAKTMEQKVESDFRHTAADVCRMFNQGVSDSTGHLLDLKALVSLMFIIRGLCRIITMNERASGPQLLWWAYSLLRGK